MSSSDLLTLTQATKSKALPMRPNTATIWRWCREGVLGRDGKRYRLQCARIGRRLLTSETWLREFGDAVAAADAGRWSDEPRAESAEHRQAVADLQSRGVL